MGRNLSRRDRQPRPVRPPARRHGRRRLVAVEGVRGRAVDAARRRHRLHLRAGAGEGGQGRLQRQLRQHVVGDGAVRGRRGTGQGVAAREALVRVHNTNTKKIIHARFALDDGLAAVDGDLAIPGVAGTGAPVRLEFREPGGATTGKLLPTGNVVDTLDVPGVGKIRASLVDAANACCFVNAADLGLTGTEMPDALDQSTATRSTSSRKSASPRRSRWASARTPRTRRKRRPCRSSDSCRGRRTRNRCPARRSARDRRRSDRAHAVQRPAASRAAADRVAVHGGRGAHRRQHRAIRSRVRIADPDAPISIAMPSGILVVAATVQKIDGAWHAEQGAFLPHAAPPVRRLCLRARVARAGDDCCRRAQSRLRHALAFKATGCARLFCKIQLTAGLGLSGSAIQISVTHRESTLLPP